MYIIIFLLLTVISSDYYHEPAMLRTQSSWRTPGESPFYKDGEFQNEESTVLMTGKHNYLTSMRDMLTGRKKSKRLIPKEGEVPVSEWQ